MIRSPEIDFSDSSTRNLLEDHDNASQEQFTDNQRGAKKLSKHTRIICDLPTSNFQIGKKFPKLDYFNEYLEEINHAEYEIRNYISSKVVYRLIQSELNVKIVQAISQKKLIKMKEIDIVVESEDFRQSIKTLLSKYDHKEKRFHGCTKEENDILNQFSQENMIQKDVEIAKKGDIFEKNEDTSANIIFSNYFHQEHKTIEKKAKLMLRKHYIEGLSLRKSAIKFGIPYSTAQRYRKKFENEEDQFWKQNKRKKLVWEKLKECKANIYKVFHSEEHKGSTLKKIFESCKLYVDFFPECSFSTFSNFIRKEMGIQKRKINPFSVDIDSFKYRIGKIYIAKFFWFFFFNPEKYEILSFDEATIDHSSLSKYAWVKTEQETHILRKPVSKLIHVITLIGLTKVEAVQYSLDSTKSTDLVSFFKSYFVTKVSQDDHKRSKTIVVLLDNSGKNTSSQFKNYLTSRNVIPIYTLPHTPMLNPIEHCFREMKRNLRKILSASRYNFTSSLDKKSSTILWRPSKTWTLIKLEVSGSRVSIFGKKDWTERTLSNLVVDRN